MKTQTTILLGILIAFSSCGSEPQPTDASTLAAEAAAVQDEVESDGPFEVKSGVIKYETKSLEGKLTATSTFYFDDYGNKLKLEETIDGETSVYTFDQKAGEGQTAFPGRKPSKIRMRQGELNMLVVMHATSGYMQQADETIAGVTCTVYANNAKSAQGESQHTSWTHKGLLLKEINRLGGGYILEAVSFEEKSVEL